MAIGPVRPARQHRSSGEFVASVQPCGVKCCKENAIDVACDDAWRFFRSSLGSDIIGWSHPHLMNGRNVVDHRLCLPMKFATLVLMLSAVSFPAVHAEDAITRNSPLAPMSQVKADHQPSSPCTPIGLTANGDIVFPWECRETIERQRGPISINVPAVSNDAPLREVPVARDTRPEETVAVAAPASTDHRGNSGAFGFPACGKHRACAGKTSFAWTCHGRPSQGSASGIPPTCDGRRRSTCEEKRRGGLAARRLAEVGADAISSDHRPAAARDVARAMINSRSVDVTHVARGTTRFKRCGRRWPCAKRPGRAGRGSRPAVRIRPSPSACTSSIRRARRHRSHRDDEPT